jgi:hypothetical protein
MNMQELLRSDQDATMLKAHLIMYRVKQFMAKVATVGWVSLTIFHFVVGLPATVGWLTALISLPILSVLLFAGAKNEAQRLEFIMLRQQVHVLEKLAGVEYIFSPNEEGDLQASLRFQGRIYDDEQLETHFQEAKRGA